MPDASLPSWTADAPLVAALLSISKSMRALHGIKLAKLGFHNGQDELLLVADRQGTTVTAIADRLSIRPSTVSKMMDRLVSKGLVERVDDIRDARRILVRITPAGINAQKQLAQVRQALELELSESLANCASPVAGSLAECASMLDARLRRLR